MFASGGMVVVEDDEPPSAADQEIKRSAAVEMRQNAWTRAAFDCFDADGRSCHPRQRCPTVHCFFHLGASSPCSGELDNDEFGDLLEGLGVATTFQQKEDMINELDVDGSGTIDFDEFSALMKGFQPDRAKERLDTWRMFSPDKEVPPSEGSFDRETFGQASLPPTVPTLIC